MDAFSFRTPIQLGKSKFNIDHQTAVMCLGSCFAEHMAEKMDAVKFPTLLNPFGILYNPLSIARSIDHMLSAKRFEKNHLVYHNGLYHSFDHHGKFSKITAEESLHLINHSIKEGATFIQNANYLIITFGTAFVFERFKTGQIVANCHKFPNNDFKRYRLSVHEIVSNWQIILERLIAINPAIKVIFSVSPVRHIRDGLVENQKSKATLLLAIDALTQQFPFISYFPSYEIVLDDLRDYRFYEEDLIHPNSQTIDYIWHHFQQHFCSPTTIELSKKIRKIEKATQHKAFHPQSQQHQNFLLKQLEQVILLEKQFPFLDFIKEKNIFRNALIN
jgi:hypothetical protein